MSIPCYSIYMKKILLLASIVWSLTSPSKVFSVSEFSTSFNSLYDIKLSGETKITHTISLKNNLTHIYATTYTIATSGDKLTNISASDETGPLDLITDVKNGITTIALKINHPSIGKDQVKTITLNYETDDVVENIGDTTTINIPRLARANEAESYTRVVKIEGVQDKPQLIYPPPSITEPDGNYAVYTFTGHQSDSLTLLFGSSVTYKLDLTYELKNKELSDIDSELALPPDTGYQHIVLSSIVPKPINIRLDSDGNWLARYSLKSQEKILVKAVLYATVYPQSTLYDPSDKTFQNTQRSKYWNVEAQVVQDLAQKLKNPQNIYEYITSNFTYNYSGVAAGSSRLGGVATLAAPTSVLCTEFTDTFVTLARSLKIPSREINGYGYTKNSTLQPQNTSTDILHAWPEYYDDHKNIWVSIDPTWGNTTGGIDYFNKLDFSHITFVRHGLEDNYPLPAGAYKSNAADKYVIVDVADEVPIEISKSETKDGFIYNTGNVAIVSDEVGYLPPYGSFKLAIPKSVSLYDKIRSLCAILLSKFWRPQSASTQQGTL